MVKNVYMYFTIVQNLLTLNLEFFDDNTIIVIYIEQRGCMKKRNLVYEYS